METIYDEKGRCISTPIIIGICSPGKHTGGADPTTMRDYGMYCAACKGKLFYEDEDGFVLRCKSCDATIGVKSIEEHLH
jgi:hypothetical protein